MLLLKKKKNTKNIIFFSMWCNFVMSFAINKQYYFLKKLIFFEIMIVPAVC